MSFVHLSEPIPNLIKEQLHVGHIGVNIFFILPDHNKKFIGSPLRRIVGF